MEQHMRSQRVIKNFFMNETTRSGGSPPRLGSSSAALPHPYLTHSVSFRSPHFFTLSLSLSLSLSLLLVFGTTSSALARVKRGTLLRRSVLRSRAHQPIRSPRGKRYYCCTTRNSGGEKDGIERNKDGARHTRAIGREVYSRE